MLICKQPKAPFDIHILLKKSECVSKRKIISFWWLLARVVAIIQEVTVLAVVSVLDPWRIEIYLNYITVNDQC